MEQVRNVRLDNLVEAVAETREKMSALRADEASSLQGCHRIMREKNLNSYRHAGVELVRVPGEEKLRVRTSNQATTASVEDEPAEPREPGEADLGDDPDGDIEGSDLGAEG